MKEEKRERRRFNPWKKESKFQLLTDELKDKIEDDTITKLQVIKQDKSCKERDESCKKHPLNLIK